MNSATNVTLQFLGVSTISSGVYAITQHDLTAGVILAFIGLICYAVYELLPNK